MKDSANLIGAVAANTYMLLIIGVFVARLMGFSEVGRWIGFASALIIVPLMYLFVEAFKADRPPIYFVWLGLMMSFALFELIFDGILRVDLRTQQWSVILYVMFFFAATGGMLGVASQAGKPWTIISPIVFIIMAVLAFVQRRITGF